MSTTIALVGNPNAGKSTIFNYYTGARQHVGNYPGITVEKREGNYTKSAEPIRILDLPGTYSLTTYSPEERVARNELLNPEVDGAICILNASALERNLYLVIQLQEIGIPFVIALNMMDEAKRNGICIDTEQLSEKLGVPVIPVIGREGKGLDTLLESAVAESKKKVTPLYISYGNDINPLLEAMEEVIKEHSFLVNRYNSRFTAIKYAEGDTDVIEEGRHSNQAISDKLEAMVSPVEEHSKVTLNSSLETLISDYRYGYINAILKRGTIFSCTSNDERRNVTEILDYILTHRILGPIIMLFVIYLVYEITFTLGVYPQEWLESLFNMLSEYVDATLPDGLLKSLITSGIIGGLSGILSFVPLVFLVFLQIAFLEDSGYMARIAYMTDRVFKVFGLHGYSAMPLIISGGIAGGCAVPGIMATRTLRSPKEKIATILATPYMACGAKLPVFILFTGIFFTEHKAEVLFLLTIAGWFFALLTSFLLRITLLKGEPAPFIMELPPYRWPTLFGMLIHSLERIIDYIKKAGTFILAASILLWGMLTFPMLPQSIEEEYTKEITLLQYSATTTPASIEYDETSSPYSSLSDTERETKIEEMKTALSERRLEYSLIGRLGVFLEPITRPLGFSWKENVALLGGIAAKELTISTLGIVYSLGEVDEENTEGLAQQIQDDPIWTLNTIWSFLLFVLLYAPCISTLAVMKQETKTYAWVAFSMISNTLLAYLVSLLLYHFI